MPIVPYIGPDQDMSHVSLILVIGVPFASTIITLGLVLSTQAVPTLLLLVADGWSPALDLLRAYRAGALFACVLCVLAPFLFIALNILLFRLWGRRMKADTVMISIPFVIWLSLICLVLVAACAWAGALWRAELPKRCVQYSADIRQIEGETLEHMTLLLDEDSTSDHMPGAPSNDLTLHRRGALGRDTGYEWITLRIPDALEFTPVPDSFVTPGQTYGWNWEHIQRYQVSYTSNFHLVTEITPIL